MDEISKKPDSRAGIGTMIRRSYGLFAPRAYTIIIFSALVFTLGAKFYQSWRCGLVHEYTFWILADISFLLGIEVVFALTCVRWPRAWLLRLCNILASLVTTWAVINAGWLIRHGTQVLPATLHPLIRDPLSSFPIVGVNLYKLPGAALLLLVPSMIMLVMVIKVIVHPVRPQVNRRFFWGRIGATLVLLSLTVPTYGSIKKQRPSQPVTSGLQFNSHIKAITSFLRPHSNPLKREDIANATRTIPTFDQVHVPRSISSHPPNLVMVVLEGIQQRYTSPIPGEAHLTPFLQELGRQGVVFSSTRSVITHTSKALFALMTGRYPSASQDVVEAIPVKKGYASLASILERQLGYRTAFMQSAKGKFESRPGLVQNLGFQTFVAREDLNDPNAHLGYLAADEFAMLPLIGQWLKKDTRPFFLTLLCSASHDPYIVPEWFREPAKEPIDRYKQVISYIDEYIRSIDVELTRLGLRDNTILCVVGDHGEGFGEHGKLGHDRIGFEEVVRIPWIVRSPRGVQPGSQITTPLSSIDVAPTLLTLMGFEATGGNFDGLDALGTVPADRKVFFTGWAPEGAAGFVMGHMKYIHNPSVEELVAYDLLNDPGELNTLDVAQGKGLIIIDTLVDWRRQSLFKPKQTDRGRILLYDTWLCRWTGRNPITRYQSL